MFKTKTPAQTASLSVDEIEILKAGMVNPSLITDYFFRLPGSEHGWRFDHNFDEKDRWQLDVCRASQRDIVVIGGFGTGKTQGVGMAACVWAVTTYPDFKFMNAAPTAKQARYMYDYIITNARGTRFEDLIFSAPETPYPKIEIRFYVGESLIISTLEFASVADDANAIFGWEGDWLNLDEAFLNDNLDSIVTITGSRLRGQIQGRTRLGRLSLITNSHENSYGWYLADLAKETPSENLTRTISTRGNHNNTDEQIALMIKRIPVEDRERFIDGTRPTGQGIYFNKDKVNACASAMLTELIMTKLRSNEAGYAYATIPIGGAAYFTTPYDPTHMYVLVGDPGTDDAPHRNSPALMVFDVTYVPAMPARLVAFWWGTGGKSITPFVGMLLRFMLTYHPFFTGVDNTGPQKGTAELLNVLLQGRRIDDGKILRWLGMAVAVDGTVHLPPGLKVEGLDFSGARKPAYLVAGRIMVEAGNFEWPDFLTGLRTQLVSYDPEKDKANQPKIPQDLVATFCMAAHVIRVWFALEIQGDTGDDTEDQAAPVDTVDDRTLRRYLHESRAAIEHAKPGAPGGRSIDPS